ncbi:polysaccharide deacetylase family protein [Desulfurella amilsii]|nr:polysaccharide deacetylase family protein [Desulfurella amilsii]
MNSIIIKVDVDTFNGLENGVPKLIKVFDEFNIKATFYVTLGPDNSGKAIVNLLKPSFLKKMLKTKATSSYGFKTALYGTILKPPILAWLKDNLLKIQSMGHEVEFHAYDHRLWQDKIYNLSYTDIKDWFEKGISAYFSIYKKYPKSFGAPGWVCSQKALNYIKGLKFIKFLSLSRADTPFIEETTQLVEIPSNLPCLEENPKDFTDVADKAINKTKNGVLPVHAEIEGGPFIDKFIKLLNLIKSNTNFLTMNEYFLELDKKNLNVRKFESKILPGRAFSCLV